jgi:uncharacterized RDD family membrane protein YckC
MTASGAPQGDDPELEQEGIWEPPPDVAAAGSSGEPAERSSSASGGLTSRLTSTAHTPGPVGLLYADVPNRIMALIIDIIALSVIGFGLAWLFGGLVSEPGALDSSGGQLDIVAFLIVLVLQLALSFAYFGGLWTLVGATAGMRLLALRIGDESDGRAITWRQALIRWLILGIPALLSSLAVYVPNTIGLILGALGVVWLLLLLYTMAQSPTRQGLHDRYAHTILVRVRRKAT